VVDETVLEKQFTLVDDESDTSYDDTEEANPTPEEIDFDTRENKEELRRPMTMKQFLKKGEELYDEAVRKAHDGQDEELPVDLEEMKARLKRFFHLPKNKDIIVRDFSVGVETERPWQGIAVFVDGMADKNVINNAILQPLMLLAHIGEESPKRQLDHLSETLLPGNQSSIVEKWGEVVAAVLTGSTVVMLDGCNGALVIETKGWEHRNVGAAQTENVVRGSHDAFTESFRANTGLVRARLRSEHLVTEMFSVGNLARTDIGLMYVHGLTNPRLVREVRRRINAIDVDVVMDSGEFEQFLEDRPSMLIPQLLATERPDRIAAALAEGYVAIFVGNNPYVLIAPVVLWSMVHSPEDSNLRFPIGTFVRGIRWIAVFVSLLLPALYVAVTNYHPEMLPTDLMLAIAGSREQVPFPVIIEILLMEFAIELIREAGIRIPSVIGPTIGIVGALIIGQAAVQAGIISPLLVIVVSATALASFTIPNYGLSMAIRITRFIFLIGAGFFGFYGIAILFCVYIVRLSMQKSFGVPLLAPLAPSSPSSRDVILRGPTFAMNKRPTFLQPLRSWRQQPMTRPWSAHTQQREGRSSATKGGKQK
jgi:spore germination protein KA